MEKTLSQDERIRRAEEIYYRRKLNNNDIRMPSSQLKEGNTKKQFSLYRKLLIQILICILVYLVFSLIKEANYIFSKDLIENTKQFLNQDINFEEVYNGLSKFIQNNQDKFNFWVNTKNEEEQQNNINETEQNLENNENGQENNKQQNINEQIEKNEIQVLDLGIGGAIENEENTEKVVDENTKKTQMEIDSEYIKTNFKMKLPAKGKITSHYGKREPTEIITENHQGIDIGITTGTTIVAAMEGKVSVVSNEGSYGTHVKIVNKDVTTIYAHCSKILVKEGDNIKLGQKIALSGNTGNTTGPHLHFEIRRNERTVDPELILNWG